MKTILVFVFILFFCSVWADEESLNVYDLKCENLTNPQGIDKTMPRLSWKVRSRNNGTEQEAFEVLVASDSNLLNNDNADLWNSGKTESSASILVPYQGTPINSGLTAYWKIRIWDQDGNVSPWSKIAEFSVGLLNKDEWKASYIGFPTDSGYNESPQLKKSFNVNETSGKFLLHVNSLGYHEVYLNGQKVGNGVLAPAVSQFNKRSWSIAYDVSSLVLKGQNDLVVWLGSGWYTSGLAGVENNGPLVKAQLEKVSGNKRETLLTTGSDWLGRKSSYSRHGDWRPHHFGGEIVDGELARTDLLLDDSVGRSWKPVSVISVPEHEVSPQMVEQNRIREIIKPFEIKSLAKDTFLIDMGKTLTGWTEINFKKLQKSQDILIEYSDHLDKNGKFVNQNQVDRYIASGEGVETFKNKFNYHGYRFIRISNLTEAPAKESINAYLIHTGYELASGFQCSDPGLNQIHDMILYTLRCLSIGGDLVDCPTIERLGYGGDGNASTETAQTMFNLNPLYVNWLQAWSDCIREDGGMPHTAPNPYGAGGGPYWCGFIVSAAWKTYLNYGDAAILEKYYPVMQKWLGYVEKYSVDGLLKRWPDTDYRGWYLGDWATPAGIDPTAETSVDLVNNCFVVMCYSDMQKIAQVLGNAADINSYAQKKDQLQKRIHQQFFDPTTNSYATGTQIDLSYPMLSGVVPEELTHLVTQNLINEITINRSGHLAVGLVGIPVLTEWALKNQAADLMYSMLKKKDYPGYLYMIENGATTTWEYWSGERSHIHNCYNGIGSWFYQAIGGICHDENVPAYQKVRIQPQIPQGITWAKTFKETPYGKLAVNWELKDEKMELEVEIPVGIAADIIFPSGVKKYSLNTDEYDISDENIGMVGLKGGKYKITYTL